MFRNIINDKHFQYLQMLICGRGLLIYSLVAILKNNRTKKNMNKETFSQLIQNGENNLVDFKVVGYFNSSEITQKNKDAEFVKDILSFANTIRQETAYIIIGIKDNGERVGITDADFTDSAILQAKIKSKVNPIPHFKAFPFYDDDNLKYQIIEIPISWSSSAYLPTVTIGNTLKRGQVYLRRLSSNEEATYDEILKLNDWMKGLPRLVQFNSDAQTNSKSNNVFHFDEVTIQKLFGNEAAEDEDATRLREYYFKNDTFDKICVDLPLRILVGHKGIGKSALFNVSMIEDREVGKLPIKIKPDDVAHLGKNVSDFSDIIRNWREGLLNIILKKVFTYFGIRSVPQIDFEIIEGRFVEFITEKLSEAYENDLLTGAGLSSIQPFLERQVINIYIDDLDRGWEGTKYDITKISALLNAVRDILNTENRKLQFKISLRSDVYFLYRTSDESTDKTQSSVIWYRWTQDEILRLLVKRIRTFFNKKVDDTLLKSLHQADLSKNLDQIVEPIFSGQGKWENKSMYQVLLSVIRKRPRDLVKLLTLAARNVDKRKSTIITTKDLKAVFDEYSLDRIQDTINEYKSELPNVERLIFGMKPDKRTAKASDSFYYTTQGLLLKINKIRERGEFFFSNGKKAEAKELAAFLYKINFLTATKVKEDGFIERKDFEENRYLVPKFEDFGYDWEVHMAFRWGLQPSNQENIYNLI